MLSSLDREKKDHYILTALAKDNPGDVASNRRENSVQVRGANLGQGQQGLGLWRQQVKPLASGLLQIGSRATQSPLRHGDRKEKARG